MTKQGPGKHYRNGITLIELARMFPDENAARQWFEGIIWPNGERHCPACESTNTYECKHPKMPYRCRECGKYFSVKTGTVMAGSPLPLLTWLYAIYLDCTSLKGVSSMKLHRDLGITQKSAWHMQQRIREAFADHRNVRFGGPVEVDESYFGGKRKNMSLSRRRALKDLGRGATGKAAVVGVKDRASNQVTAKVVQRTDGATLKGFVGAHAKPGATVYTDEAGAYKGLPFKHESVAHSAGEYVRDQAHTNGIESFWASLKRAHDGTFHKLSPKHLQRYVNEFAARHNIRERDTIRQMATVAAALAGKLLPYKALIADNGLPNGSRS